jgi:TPR repeat protein
VGTRSPLNALFACVIFALSLSASQSLAETRRAFLVGNQAYKDGDIQQLQRSANDAKDVAKDLEETGFDKKNIKVVTDIKNKNAFDKEFDAFLKTVEAGDIVFFYFSGHGFGVEAEQNNYLLFTDLKSPFTFARAQMPEKDRKNSAVVRLRVANYLEAYHRDEIPLSGVSTTEIEQKIYERRAKTVVMILDACRSLVKVDDGDETSAPRSGGSPGSQMITTHQPPRNFLLLYSASFGEQAVESVDDSGGRNSRFTEVFRAELMRPGQSLKELAVRVKLMVRATAQGFGEQQEPEYVANGPNLDDTYLIDPIGRERFQMSQEKCDGGEADWKEIKDRHKRELFERHIRRFDTCPTAEYARRRLSELTLSADDSDEFENKCLEAKEDWQKIRGARNPPDLENHIRRFDGCATGELARRWLVALGAGSAEQQADKAAPRTAKDIRNISDCDLLAASDLDRDRPPEVPGLPFEKIIADDAIEACQKAISDSTPRYLFNLGRAYHKRASDPELGLEERRNLLRRARVAYEDAERRSYRIALGHLAVLLESGDGVQTYKRAAIEMLKRGAEQRQPHAMYLLGLHFRNGDGVERDAGRALELFRSAAEGGILAAKIEAGNALINRRPFWKPRAGVALLQEAAEAGSTRAQMLLAAVYSRGAMRRYPYDKAINEVPRDDDLTLLWLGRLAEQGDTEAQAYLADRMQNGIGLSAPQPEASERYWRLAAQGGNPTAQVTFADRLRRGFVLVKQEYGAGDEGIKVLRQAMSQGSAQAALALAQIYRAGELGQEKNPRQAVMYAFNAIELATQSDASPKIGEPFPEMAAAHLIAEMIKTNEAVDNSGGPLLTSEEVERLERFYGKVDASSKQVKIRRLAVTLTCGSGKLVKDKETNQYRYEVQSDMVRPIWVWDWGRRESPTEFQFRSLERETNCDKNALLRRTLSDVYDQAKKNDVPFADLVEQKIKIAKGEESAPVTRGGRRHGRGRRH